MKTSTKKISILLASIISLSLYSCQIQDNRPDTLVLDDNIFSNGAGYSRGFGGGNNGGGFGQGVGGGKAENNNLITQQLDSIKPIENLSEQEKKDLIFMREEEKLARDFYKSMYDKWKQKSFDNISKSEQFHMDAIKLLLDRYKIEDPIGNNSDGFFKDTKLQELYNSLIKDGNTSLETALKLGAKVEEIDIKDLKTSVNNTKAEDIKLVYDSLMSASENHLRAFVSNLNKFYKNTYTPQVLTKEEFDAIVK